MLKFFLTALFASGTLLFAADASLWKAPTNAQSPEVQKVMKVLSESETVSGTFVQKRTVVKIKRTFESSGKFEISQKKIVQTNADGSQVEMASSDNVIFREIAASMRAVLGGNLAALENRFELYFLQKKNSWNVGLVPKEKMIQSTIASIALEGDQCLKKVELVDGEGNVLTYEFKQSGK